MKKQFETNTRIEELIRDRDEAREEFSEEDKKLIGQYTGAGGLSKAGARGRGILYEFYTPDFLAEFMWKAARHYGFPQGGRVLEPSAGIGRIIRTAPPGANITAFETNSTSARIIEILYPEVDLHKGYFETAFMERPRFRSRMKGKSTWLEDAPFDLVIGNPPFGKYKNLYSSYFKSPNHPSNEAFFTLSGLELLRVGGLMVFILPSGFIRNGYAYYGIKDAIARHAKILDAYRLPSVFKGTKVPVDLFVFQKTHINDSIKPHWHVP